MRTRQLLAAAVIALSTAAVRAEVKTETVEYKVDGKTFKGLIAFDDAIKDKRPGVLIVHEIWGLNDYVKDRAKQLAALGYVAFAGDLFGDGVVTVHPQEAMKMGTELRKNKEAWLARAKASLKVLADHERVDPKRLAAIGYCFGGSTAQVLAYEGTPLSAIASFHGSLVVPTAEQAKAVKCKMLICHGADDTFIKKETVDEFQKVLKDNKVDLQFESYPGVLHSFTVPGAEKAGIPGLKYDEKADKQSWESMKKVFEEVFKK